MWATIFSKLPEAILGVMWFSLALPGEKVIELYFYLLIKMYPWIRLCTFVLVTFIKTSLYQVGFLKVQIKEKLTPKSFDWPLKTSKYRGRTGLGTTDFRAQLLSYGLFLKCFHLFLLCAVIIFYLHVVARWLWQLQVSNPLNSMPLINYELWGKASH